MVSKILMPSGGQTTDEMVILKWNKAVGDFVKRGDILFEIETDKAILTVESFAEGTLLNIMYPEGQMVKTGEIVAYIGKPEDKVTDDKTPVIQDAFSAIETKQSLDTTEKPHALEVEAFQVNRNEEKSYKHNGDILQASPLAKSKAKIENIKLEDVAQFFTKKMIRKKDIDSYLAQTGTVKEEDGYLVAVTSMRRTIAKRMKESVSTAPHFIISVDVDMSETIDLRLKLNRTDAIKRKITYNDIFMKVVAKAIETNPLINATYQNDNIKVYKDVNCGLAVALDAGLVVPVTPQINRKSIAEIAAVNEENIKNAKNNNLNTKDISGGTITLSNLGMFGINNFTAILNQPESCILAMGSIIAKTVVIDRQIVIRDIMNITASFDHRVIDGAVGAAFLKEVKTILENPHLLLL